MKNKLLFFILFAVIIGGCNRNHSSEPGDEHAGKTGEPEHEDEKIQLTIYSSEFELFAEADAFVAGKTSNVLSHITHLHNFSALESGVVTLRLIINRKEISQTLENPTRKGIYSFDIQPETSGTGKLIYDIKTETGNYQVEDSNITVFATKEEANEYAETAVPSKTNTTVFTKEQSWKIDFATELPVVEPFGQVIKTTAQIKSAQGDEMIIGSKTSGIVKFSDGNITVGKSISNRQILFTIAGNGMADNNSAVRFTAAKNNYEKAASEFERSKELAKDKIVSEKDLLASKTRFENAKAIFDNLNQNFNAAGQNVTSPFNGFIKQLFVQNGQFIEAGQPIAMVSQNKTLVLKADVQQKYAPVLGTMQSATVRTLNDDKIWSLEELNGKILSTGKTTNPDNYLIPVSLQIDNKGNFIPGSFVELYLKSISNSNALTVPNSALMEQQGAYFVFVQINPELFEKREIQTGPSDGIKTEIKSGINKNERIVTKGAILIKLSQASGTLDAHSGHVH